MSRVTWNLHNALTQWQWSPFSFLVLFLIGGAAYWYLKADWMLATRGRKWPRHRTAFFMSGLFALDLALQSPISTFTGSYFQAHVVQHLLLMIVAPPLLALGAPSTLLLQTSSRRTKTSWLKVLHSRPFAVLTHPLTVWFLYFGLMFAFFLTPLINVAMTHMWLMDIMNLLFFFSGTLYWWPMVGIDPIVHWRMSYGARMLNVVLGAAPEVILGLAILSSRTPIASMYSLSSTHAGGSLLWASTEVATLIGAAPIFYLWMRSDEREAKRIDARADRLAEEEALGLTPPPVPAVAPVEPAMSGASERVDWKEMQVDTWEAMFRAKARRVPVTRAYKQASLDESRAMAARRQDTPPATPGDLPT